jgi:DNA mismatch endonuclease (patch repair protein)
MSRVRSTRNKTTDIALARLLRHKHVSGWRRHVRMLGNPDFVFRSERVLVFVDGCFWHGHRCRPPVYGRNKAIWAAKLARNVDRDRKTRRQLRALGWSVLRVWECEVSCGARRALSLLRRRLQHGVRS